MHQIDIKKHIESKIIYVKYQDATHNGWRAISNFLSPPLPSPDPTRQENRSRFRINSSKNLGYPHKNSVWHAARIAAHAGDELLWKWRHYGHCPPIVLIVRLRFQITIIFWISSKLGKRVRSNHKIRYIWPICTCRFKKMCTCSAKTTITCHLQYLGALIEIEAWQTILTNETWGQVWLLLWKQVVTCNLTWKPIKRDLSLWGTFS